MAQPSEARRTGAFKDPGPVAPRMHPVYGPSYRSARSLVPWLIGLTVLAMAVQVAFVFLPQPDPDATAAAAMRQAVVSLGIMALLAPLVIAQLVVALIWFHRTHANLQAFGAPDLKWTPGWAVGAWFIPLANLVIPIMIIAEQWKASHPESAQRPWTSLALPAWIVLWWALWVLQGVIGAGVGLTASLRPEASVMAISLAAAALYIVAGVFFLNYASQVTAFQDARAGDGLGPDVSGVPAP